jgi:signal transduction histidine kinase
MDENLSGPEQRVLIVAPSGNDAANAALVLAEEDIHYSVCGDVVHMCTLAGEGVGALLFTQESLTTAGLNALKLLLQEQPAWSDIPMILLTVGGDATIPGLNSLRSLGYSSTLTVLERPLRVVTLVSSVKAALRSRRRQYEVRDLLKQRDTIAGELQERAKVLEASQLKLIAAQEQISRHARELEQTVAERTAKLRETVAQLEAFSYSISHDMRGPLRAMQQYAQILLEDYEAKLDEDAMDYLRRIARGANRLDRLIQDVLTYSRVARNAMPLVPIDLDKLVQDIVQQYPTFQAPNAIIEVEGPLPGVIGNEASLTQCISNLLANAVKFVPSGKKPHVRVYPGEQNGKVSLVVEDNGIGIAPEHQSRIFDIFERINGNSDYEGTGIGLSIVKKTVERMGGEVGVESQLGKGSKFWIKLLPATAKS